jgi:Aromatic acid exporter family member 2
MFSVGITTAVTVINRLDQLMLATKEVVGEHYHIHGVGGGTSAPILKEGPRQFAAQFKPPGDGVV